MHAGPDARWTRIDKGGSDSALLLYTLHAPFQKPATKPTNSNSRQGWCSVILTAEERSGVCCTATATEPVKPLLTLQAANTTHRLLPCRQQPLSFGMQARTSLHRQQSCGIQKNEEKELLRGDCLSAHPLCQSQRFIRSQTDKTSTDTHAHGSFACWAGSHPAIVCVLQLHWHQTPSSRTSNAARLLWGHTTCDSSTRMHPQKQWRMHPQKQQQPRQPAHTHCCMPAGVHSNAGMPVMPVCCISNTTSILQR